MRSRASSATVIPIQPQPLFKAEPKVYPRWVSGLFQRWRWFFVVLTQLVFYGLCWIPWNGRQAVLFDLEARRFYLFDLVLWPQDTIYLAVLLVLSALALFLFTAVAGRLWCGYTCPQTVYTEIFLWIEKLAEGAQAAARFHHRPDPRSPRRAHHQAWLRRRRGGAAQRPASGPHRRDRRSGRRQRGSAAPRHRAFGPTACAPWRLRGHRQPRVLLRGRALDCRVSAPGHAGADERARSDRARRHGTAGGGPEEGKGVTSSPSPTPRAARAAARSPRRRSRRSAGS